MCLSCDGIHLGCDCDYWAFWWMWNELNTGVNKWMHQHMILLGVKCGTCPFFSSESLESFRICLNFPAFVQKPWHKYDRLDAIKRLKSLCLGLWLKEHLSWQCQHNVNIMSLCSEMRNFNEFQVWSCLRCWVWWRGQFGGKRLKIVSRSLSKTITCPYLRHNADSSRSESSKNQFISRSTMNCVF